MEAPPRPFGTLHSCKHSCLRRWSLEQLGSYSNMLVFYRSFGELYSNMHCKTSGGGSLETREHSVIIVTRKLPQPTGGGRQRQGQNPR